MVKQLIAVAIFFTNTRCTRDNILRLRNPEYHYAYSISVV